MRSEAKVIRGGRILAGPELRPVDGALVIEGERIAALEPAGSASVSGDAESFDATGATLIPGFIDCHVHIGLHDPAEVLSGGVTTARDLAWPPEELWPLVERSRSASFAGPTLVAAGQMLTAPGGYPTRAQWAPEGTGLVVGDAERAGAAVASQVRRGAIAIKVALNPAAGPTLDESTLEAIVNAAHAAGLKTTGHVYGLDELDKALRAGLDELAHTLMSPEAIPDDMIRAMVDRGMVVVPTLAIFFDRARSIAIDNLARFRAAGGLVVYGTDLGNRGPRPGIDPREVEGMLEAGFAGRDVIASATVDASRWIDLNDVGVLEVGALADVVAVGGDPLADARAITRVVSVWRRGRKVT